MQSHIPSLQREIRQCCLLSLCSLALHLWIERAPNNLCQSVWIPGKKPNGRICWVKKGVNVPALASSQKLIAMRLRPDWKADEEDQGQYVLYFFLGVYIHIYTIYLQKEETDEGGALSKEPKQSVIVNRLGRFRKDIAVPNPFIWDHFVFFLSNSSICSHCHTVTFACIQQIQI